MNYGKRLVKEKAENAQPLEQAYTQPLPGGLHRWHFTLRGVAGTPFEGGLYHGELRLPENYPLGPPEVFFRNASGRFEVDKAICLSASNYHAEQWTPAWTIRSLVQALAAYFLDDEPGIGSLQRSAAERKQLAATSPAYVCPDCGALGELARRVWGGGA